MWTEEGIIGICYLATTNEDNLRKLSKLYSKSTNGSIKPPCSYNPITNLTPVYGH
jgi:hypothetical protein